MSNHYENCEENFAAVEREAGGVHQVYVTPTATYCVDLNKASNSGIKYDTGKPRLELLPPSYWEVPRSLVSIDLASWYFYGHDLPSVDYDPTPVLAYGANKYADHNWYRGLAWGRIVGAAHRHANEWRDGAWRARDLDELDAESGLPHGAHLACCLLFLREYYEAWLLTGKYDEYNDCPWVAELTKS